MADIYTSPKRSWLMGRIKSKNTKPEMLVRKSLHSLGYRFRVHRADLPGKPDIVFSTRSKVIMVHGCFWHQHDDPCCKKATIPSSNEDFWSAKLSANRERDRRVEEQLRLGGWSILVVWECQLRDQDKLFRRLQEFIGAPGKSKSTQQLGQARQSQTASGAPQQVEG